MEGGQGGPRAGTPPFTVPTSLWASETARNRPALATCRICGAAVLMDSRDDFDVMELHRRYHDMQDGEK